MDLFLQKFVISRKPGNRLAIRLRQPLESAIYLPLGDSDLLIPKGAQRFYYDTTDTEVTDLDFRPLGDNVSEILAADIELRYTDKFYIDENTSPFNNLRNCTTIRAKQIHPYGNLLAGLFKDCQHLERIETQIYLDKNDPDMTAMCSRCYSLKEFDFNKIIFEETLTKPRQANLYYTFNDCTALTRFIPPKDYRIKSAKMYYFLQGCSALKTADLSFLDIEKEDWTLSNRFVFNGAFYNCTKLETIITGKWTLTNLSDYDRPYCFVNCTNLKDIVIGKDGYFLYLFPVNNYFYFHYSKVLSPNCVRLIMGALSNPVLSSPRWLTLSSNVKELVTEEEVARATSINWTIVFM